MLEDVPEAKTQATPSPSGDSSAPPVRLPLIPVTHTTLFPGMVVPVILPSSVVTVVGEETFQDGKYLGVVYHNHPLPGTSGGTMFSTGVSSDTGASQVEIQVPGQAETVEFSEGDYLAYGVAAKILKRIHLPDDQSSLLLAGLKRFRVQKVEGQGVRMGNVEYLEEVLYDDTETEALVRSATQQFRELAQDNPLISDEAKVAVMNIEGAGKLTDFMGSVLVRDVADYQKLLAATDVKQRLRHLLEILRREQDVQAVQRKIHDDINSKISGAQREYYLSEQLKLIQKELGGHSDTRSRLLNKFRTRISALSLNDEAEERIQDEMDKLQSLNEQASEYSVCINYLDWVTSLPWGKLTDESCDIRQAKKVLDEDHHGLKDVKERILEFLAVRKLRGKSDGSIICFVGAPGTGKTSLGRSIARALGRKFYRFSVGGMRDEAEIKGHRKTYVGAMPGKLIQGLKRAGVLNPVFLIDEVDKIGTGMGTGGDPASALLEVLDPEQNQEFLDHYVDLPFDLSQVLFLTTANNLDSIPGPLLDRMEIIELHGYSESEKFAIAKKHLIPKQMQKNGIKRGALRIRDKGLKYVIEHYAREAGVRTLEKEIGRLCRKVAYRLAYGKKDPVVINDGKTVEKYLGKPPFSPESLLDREVPGVVTGLAWTPYGGEVLFVESLAVEGKGDGLTLTGSLGDVMQESANIAYTLVRRQCEKSHKDYFEKKNLHLHVPAGATPKDGPSAGITMAASLYSLIHQKPVKEGVAMTGELTLSGRVLPVGGIKEKILAAKRAHCHTVVVPKENQRDLKELEPDIKKGMHFVKVSHIRDCFNHIF